MIFVYLVSWILFSHTVLLRLFTCLKRKSRLDLSRITLHDKWKILSSHRGGSYERAENTLNAFKHAMSEQSNLLECDVHMTLDDVVVIAHDDDLSRVCGVDKRIAELAYSELPPMLRSVPLHFAEGDY